MYRVKCDIYKTMLDVQSQNVILSRLFSDMSKYGHKNIERLRRACMGLVRALNASIQVAQVFKENLDEFLSEMKKSFSKNMTYVT